MSTNSNTDVHMFPEGQTSDSPPPPSPFAASGTSWHDAVIALGQGHVIKRPTSRDPQGKPTHWGRVLTPKSEEPIVAADVASTDWVILPK